MPTQPKCTLRGFKKGPNNKDQVSLPRLFSPGNEKHAKCEVYSSIQFVNFSKDQLNQKLVNYKQLIKLIYVV